MAFSIFPVLHTEPDIIVPEDAGDPEVCVDARTSFDTPVTVGYVIKPVDANGMWFSMLFQGTFIKAP